MVERVGAGGMGVVYRAYDPELHRKVALKVLHASRSRIGADSRAMLEAEALARLTHPNVVTVHDVGAHGERVWLAMELVEAPRWRR